MKQTMRIFMLLAVAVLTAGQVWALRGGDPIISKGTVTGGDIVFYSDQDCNSPITKAEAGTTVYIKATPNGSNEICVEDIVAVKTIGSNTAESRRSESEPTTIPLGEQVAVTAVSDATGLFQLTMPESNVKVSATFTAKATVKVVWNDDNNRDGIRPESVGATLLNNSAAPQESNHWEVTVHGLPAVDANGDPIVYEWTGSTVNGYELTSETTDNVTTLTYSHTPAVTSATVKVVWNDFDNHDNKRPASVTATLSDNEHQVTLNQDNSWTATVENLPKNSAGVPIAYTWSVVTPEGYTKTITTLDGVTAFMLSYTPTVAFAFGADQTWMTWCGSEVYALPTGLEAYTVSGLSEDGTNVLLEPATTITANTPLLLKGTAGMTYAATLTTAGTATGLVNTTIENVLTFYGNPTNAVITTGNYCVLGKSYVLHKGAFVLVDTDNGIPAHKCLLTLSSAVTARLSLVMDGATGIATTPGPSFPKEGNSAGWYDLQGRKLSGEPVKHGIYIFNGEKVKK